ncbi:DUF2680 domain-containing protein [Turicibacter sanguinis]|uniref:DUF2680 domain-containing protein n=1 Tax=Turicibacter sanguinis TaxID=154288 RepID=UPI0012BC4D70|nr:DUF2680 domain-containing protein [Turicibacter sanguinis]MDB8584038.1 DUF2680 domain-containing protein [Turicibacter sanguinis]MTK19247.1 DUF2680 domain-containing protein [Turicibacter sanguinis]MTK97207.1 DUF2680 domain-containing protein [Turicibacter sanguinis]MTM00714.1 DUF2680 domain-containing protein [Turicibacter sanguinis]MTM40626.1 DUF2680 domain-containing protein [Turicibacter sanguinis]
MKKVISIFTACMLVGLGGINGQAAEKNDDVISVSQQLTEDQKAEMAKHEQKFKEAQAKFDALTADQKKEIYDLFDKVNVAKVKLLDKYVEYGIISKDEAQAMQKYMAEFSEKARNEQMFIGVAGPRGPKAPKPESETKEESKTSKTQNASTEKGEVESKAPKARQETENKGTTESKAPEARKETENKGTTESKAPEARQETENKGTTESRVPETQKEAENKGNLKENQSENIAEKGSKIQED